MQTMRSLQCSFLPVRNMPTHQMNIANAECQRWWGAMQIKWTNIHNLLFKINVNAANWYCITLLYIIAENNSYNSSNTTNYLSFDFHMFLKLMQDFVRHLFGHIAHITLRLSDSAAALGPQHEEACCVEVSNNTPQQTHVLILNSFVFIGTHRHTHTQQQQPKLLMQLLPVHLMQINVNNTSVSRCSLL